MMDMKNMKMPMKSVKAAPVEGAEVEMEEGMEDPNYEMEEEKDMSAMLVDVSDDELLKEMKRRGLSGSEPAVGPAIPV